MSTALISNSLIEIWFTYQEHRAALVALAEGAGRTRPPRRFPSSSGNRKQSRLDHPSVLGDSRPWSSASSTASGCCVRCRRSPSCRLLDDQGREQLRISRQAMDRVGGNVDFSAEDKFKTPSLTRSTTARSISGTGSEPFMTLSVAGARREAGVSVAEVNLTHHLGCGQPDPCRPHRRASVVGGQGGSSPTPTSVSCCATPTSRGLAQVRRARQAHAPGTEQALIALDERGERVLTAYAKATPLDWLVFVEIPESEADEPLYAAITRSADHPAGRLSRWRCSRR